MRNYFSKTLGVLGATLLLLSCKQDQVGPDLVSLNTDFNPSDVVMTAEKELSTTMTPKITANWGQKVTYELMVKGLVSGAIKTYKGTAVSVDVLWEGLSSNIYFFKTGESASVELKLVGEDSVFVCNDTIEVKNSFEFDGKKNKWGKLFFT